MCSLLPWTHPAVILELPKGVDLEPWHEFMEKLVKNVHSDWKGWDRQTPLLMCCFRGHYGMLRLTEYTYCWSYIHMIQSHEQRKQLVPILTQNGFTKQSSTFYQVSGGATEPPNEIKDQDGKVVLKRRGGQWGDAGKGE